MKTSVELTRNEVYDEMKRLTGSGAFKLLFKDGNSHVEISASLKNQDTCRK
jgi:hypothetical protein